MLKINYPQVKKFLETQNTYFYPVNEQKYRIIKNQFKFELNLQESTLRDLENDKITPVNEFNDVLNIINKKSLSR